MIRTWAILAPAMWLVGCSGCGEEPLATLVEHRAAVERDHSASVGKWRAVDGAERFFEGDGLRTFVGAEAMLQLAGGGKVQVEADTTIRFRRDQHEGKALTSVDIESGFANVESGDAALGVQTRFGLAVLSRGAKLRVDRAGGAERYRVDIGEAIFPGEGGGQRTVAAGGLVDIGLAQLEPTTPKVVEAPPPVEPEPESEPEPEPESEPETEARAIDTTESGPPKDTLVTVERVDLTLPLGGSVTINDPKPPTAVGMQLSELCPAGGALEVERRRAHGARVQFALKPGTHSYRVMCLDDAGRAQRTVAARGTIRVRRATGAAQLPTSAPRNRIDTDGRRYTVMFQNLLPEIEVRWPNPPAASGYVLERVTNGQTTTERSDKPIARFTGGQIPEGQHRLRFKVASNPAQASMETTLAVRFDNAAPSVSLRQPAVAGFDAGSEVRVMGMAIADARVSVFGESLSLDRQHRFDTSVQIPPGSDALAVRIDHPRSGVQYYVRRKRGAQ